MNAPGPTPAPIRLVSGRLAVTIAAPPALTGARFDRTASIAQVVLDGRHAFCGAEDGGTRGVGLCAEFGIMGTIGYDDAKPGEAFLKPGVGVLTRLDDKPYEFARAYPVAPVAIDMVQDGDAATFRSADIAARGWAVGLERRVRVDDDRLSVETTLRNRGERAFAIEEYNHNFLAAGPGDHRLAIEGSVDAQTGWFADVAGALTWPAPERGARYTSRRAEAVTGWSWRDPASGRSVRETVSMPCARVALFVTPSLVCPEAFVRLSLAPGESATWRREWTFAHA